MRRNVGGLFSPAGSCERESLGHGFATYGTFYYRTRVDVLLPPET